MATKQTDRAKLLAALEGAARLTRTEISYDVFGRHRTMAQIDALLGELAAEGLVARTRIESNGHRDKPIEMWEVISHATSNSRDPEPEADAPPSGEGWLPKTETLRRAQRGVMPASAERVGKKLRRTATRYRGHTGQGKPRVTDETRGATHLIGKAYRNYLTQGVIEVEGDWIRLVTNPTRRPPRHWHEALLHILAEGHPTLDGKWHRQPKKTLVGVMEDALGRKLEPHELVRRRPGTAGSWNPADIVLHDYATNTMTTLADIRAEQP
jgi:hypothetical protein